MVSAIKVVGGIINDEDVVSKALRTLLPIYAIRVSSIQEFRAILGNVLTLDALVGSLTTFELSNFDNSLPKVENVFKSSLNIGSSRKDKCSRDESDSSSNEKELDELEALLARRLPIGKGKFKGKLL